MNIATQREADQLNETGEYGPYQAANGHRMVASVEFPVDERDQDLPWREQRHRFYRVGDRIRYQSYSAWCANECRACQEGDPLPDW